MPRTARESSFSIGPFNITTDRDIEQSSQDILAKVQQFYWQAKQKYLAKVQRCEDACIVLGDADLDARLDIFSCIDSTSEQLARILDLYQDCLFKLANEQNELGAMLKQCSKVDKTIAGKVMSVAARSMNEASHQQIQLYMPLLRMHQEMETFHSRACDDCTGSVDCMEEKRSKYRASLLWMKDVSESLTDPDRHKQLAKFKKVQAQVKKNKLAFDELQADVVQKIDLLMASRCNLINSSLASYQATLQEAFDNNAAHFKQAIDDIKNQDFYDYEFKTLKELNPMPVSRELSADDLAHTAASQPQNPQVQQSSSHEVSNQEPLLQLEEALEAISLSNSLEVPTKDSANNNNSEIATGNLLGDFDA